MGADLGKPKRRTKKRSLAAVVANSLRGNEAMADAILNVHREISSRRSESLGDIRPAVLRNAFAVPATGFGQALNIGSPNLVQVEKLNRPQAYQVELNYLRLACLYVLQNSERVNSWIELNARASALSFSSDGEEIKQLILALPAVDQQALASMKLYAALHSFSDDMVREYLNRNLTSHWTQTRLLYPLVYYSINLPEPHVLHQMLDHVFPAKGTGPAEKMLTRFLLEPERPETATLALRCYVSLLSHPYDALEYIVTDLERRLATGAEVPADYLDQFALLGAAFPRHKVAELVRLAAGEKLVFADRPEHLFGFDFDHGSPELAALLSVLDAREEQPPLDEAGTALLKAVMHARWNRYPERSQFDELSAFHRRFAMLSSGALVRFISTSLFLFSREGPFTEALDLLRGSILTGVVTPFSVTGPGGRLSITSQKLRVASTPSEMRQRIGAAFGADPVKRPDRVWIKAANWDLLPLQEAGKVREWLQAARERFPIWVQPRYLSGLDWHWLSQVIGSIGMRPLMGSSDGIYILFMRQLEEFRRESVPLRLAIEPIARARKQISEFVEWLFAELGENSGAFVRYFLSADTILKLRLADNYVAAISFRLALLETCVRQFGFQPGILEEQDLAREQEALTGMLCRMSVGARQFELNWSALKEDALLRNRDTYSAYETVKDAISTDSVSNTKRTSTFQFSNGGTADYEARNREWPLVLVIAGIIDAFLTHPTSGIEAILSVRIRHDALRREFASALQQVASGAVAGVGKTKSRELVNRLSVGVYREVQRWIDLHVHTSRKDKPSAFFDFIPSRKEMTELVEGAIDLPLPDIIDSIFEWVKPRLADQLERARDSLVTDLGRALERRVGSMHTELVQSGEDEDEVRRVSHAVGAALARRCTELQEWFRIPEHDREHSLTVAEVLNAVGQRFRMDAVAGQLRLQAPSEPLGTKEVAPAHVRQLYDLLSETVQNALKHSQLGKNYVRLTLRGSANCVVVSNARKESDPVEEVIEGYPYATLHDSLFGEGNTGLKKIAYIAASIANSPVSLSVRASRRYFHLLLPAIIFGCGEEPSV